MISSKDLIHDARISRATLNNYIQHGLLPKPEVGARSDLAQGMAKNMGYFPVAALDRIDEIRQLKRNGWRMEDIVAKLATVPLASIQENPMRARRSAAQSQLSMSGAATNHRDPVVMGERQSFSMPLSLDNLQQPAYMVNYNMELVWYNEPARTRLFGFNALPNHSNERCLFQLLSRPDVRLTIQDQRALAAMNLRFALLRVRREALTQIVEHSAPDLFDVLSTIEPITINSQQAIAEDILQQSPAGGQTTFYQAYAVYFREGILMVLSPESDTRDDLLNFLSRRDKVIENLLRKRLPVMTPLAVLVADLQNSVRICSELLPDEYFELINQIWNTMAPVLRKYGGTYGKHVGDGMVYYFFPQPETNYLFNAVACAAELREAMFQISSEWQLRKRWFTELQLNIGLHEGQEWLGTFQSTNQVEFVVLGDTINHAARLSDFARQGSIWATKNLVSRLTPDERSRIEFGVLRQSQEFGDRFIPASYAQIETLIPVTQDRYEKMRDIAHLAVTEIRRVSATRGY